MFFRCWLTLTTFALSSAVTKEPQIRLMRTERWDSLSSYFSTQQQHSRPSIEPVFYVHVPKAGSGFATAIAHLFCGDRIEKQRTVKIPTQDLRDTCGPEHFMRFEKGHDPLKQGVDPSKVVTMLRRPRQRIISGYFHGLHDCRPLQEKYNLSTDSSTPQLPLGLHQVNSTILMEYANCVQACATNMLNGYNCGELANQTHKKGLKEAVDIVQKLGYIGLTDHWELSMCLWHAMFGGECLASEFEVLRPGLERKDRADYDESAFGEWYPDDQVLYDAAKKRVEQQMIAYNVNPYSCATQYCPNLQHLFGYRNRSFASLLEFTCTNLDSCTWPGRRAFDED